MRTVRLQARSLKSFSFDVSAWDERAVRGTVVCGKGERGEVERFKVLYEHRALFVQFRNRGDLEFLARCTKFQRRGMRSLVGGVKFSEGVR